MRLTYKDKDIYGGYDALYSDEFACVTKLGPLEDIEDELGVDLITLFNENPYAKQLLYNLVNNIPFVFTGKGEELK